MKYCLIFIILGIGSCFANESYSQKAFFTFEFKNQTVKEIIREIEQNSEYIFFYLDNSVDLNRKVSISAENEEIEKILDQLFTGTPNRYSISDRQIVISSEKISRESNSVAVQQQQTRTITGIVRDATGPVVGASVVEKGTTNGIATNIDGQFTLTNIQPNAVLQISYIGYMTQEVTVGNQTNLDITIQEDNNVIDDVVVVGYGTQKKSTLTGSVVAVDNKELITTKNSNIQNMITGKLPGVRNIQKTSEPGRFNNQFDIRGMGTPLIVVDGVPRSDFPRMDPNDVESISVLKDASAAIYGVRAANGVILITTKKGEKGKVSIEYSGYYGIQTMAERLHPLNAWDRAILFNESTMRNLSGPVKTYDDDYFNRLKSGEAPDTDWYGALLRETAPQQQQNISVSGGGEKMDYYINFGYTNQSSFFKTNPANYDRYNFRINVNAQITNQLKIGAKLNMIMDETNRQYRNTWDIFKNIWRSSPEFPLYANNTEPYFYMNDQTDFNPLPQLMPDVSGFVNNKKNFFQSNMYLEYDIPFIKGLKARGMFSYDKYFNYDAVFAKGHKEYRYNAAADDYTFTLRNSPTYLERSDYTGYTTLWNAQLNYDNTFAGIHRVGALLLYEESYHQDYDLKARREFEIPIPYLFAGKTENQQGYDDGVNEYAYKAIVGRLNYDYAGKYMAEFSFRRDGSSKFPKSKQWGFFPSVLLAYRISEESFIKDKLSFIQNLKIRGTWGKTGDDSALQFQFIEGYDYPQKSFHKEYLPVGYWFGNTFVNAMGFRNAPNSLITWYTAIMKNIGMDTDFLKGLFGFSVDLFQRDRNGLLDTPAVVVPGSFGAGISQANMNSDRTKGFEIELRHRNRINQFDYFMTGSVQMTRTMITKRIQPPRSNSYDYWRNNVENRYNDIWFLYEKAGTYKSWDEIANSIYAGAGTLPGDPIYIDWNGDGVIDAMDMHPIATTTNPSNSTTDARNYPLMNFGITLGGQWKGIDCNFLFQGAAMAYVGYTEQLLSPAAGNALAMMYDRWHPVDPDVDPYNPATKWISGYYPYGRTRAMENSTFNIQNGAYMRLKSAEIGYTIPGKIVLDKLGVKNLRIYVNAYNLLTITGVRSLDPEKPSEESGYMYPLNRTFNFGGSIKF